MKSSFTAEDMAQLVGTDACVATDDTGATINKYTQAGVFNVYFTAVPVDVVGNIATAGSIDYIEYSRDTDNTNPGDEHHYRFRSLLWSSNMDMGSYWRSSCCSIHRWSIHLISWRW